MFCNINIAISRQNCTVRSTLCIPINQCKQIEQTKEIPKQRYRYLLDLDIEEFATSALEANCQTPCDEVRYRTGNLQFTDYLHV
jgi:hypothetical protein